MTEPSQAHGDFEAVVRELLAPRYDVRRQVGRGSMALVFQAQDRRSGDEVAIKVLRRELAASLGPTRFHREIDLLSRLHHLNILRLLESVEIGPLLYFTMPYVAGESLRVLLEREGPLPIDRVLAIARNVAAALDYAHCENVLHRDIKPENILLEGDRALLCDFGVARAIEQAASDRISSSGIVVGTPSYMSPEQAQGAAALDARCDIYAFGCVLYEMLTGEKAFSGVSTQAIFAKQIGEPPRALRVLRPDLPPPMEAAVLQSLAKHPSGRPWQASKLVQALLREG
jgi:serine/threonine-protein kinase